MAGEQEWLASGLGTVLARVRCEAIHGQTNGGRCANCISWAKTIGVPEHLPRLAAAAQDAAQQVEARMLAAWLPDSVPDGNGQHTSPMADALFNEWAVMDQNTGDYAAGERLAAAAMSVVRAALTDPDASAEWVDPRTHARSLDALYAQGVEHGRAEVEARVLGVVEELLDPNRMTGTMPNVRLQEGRRWADRIRVALTERGGVGTGAGEGATGQDTGTAWVTRSEDYPKAPAQARLPAHLSSVSDILTQLRDWGTALVEADRYRSIGRDLVGYVDRLRALLTDPDALDRLLREARAEAEAAHRQEWADHIDHWDGAVGPEPPTVRGIVAALRGPVPFGCAANPDTTGEKS